MYGFTLAQLELEAREDWEDIRHRPEAMRQFALALLEDQQIRAGIVPERWTGTATCAKCGEVWVPPHLAGWKMAGCRWCSVRRAGRAIHKASLSTDPIQ